MRLDQLLHHRGLYPSREQARRAVMAGSVLVDGQKVDKPGTAVKDGAELRILGGKEPFVSRAGRKLAHALDHFAVDPFGLDPAGFACLDVGASTGGFTDCLLQRGAVHVHALDVGYNQLVHPLRIDPRVTVMERVNARHLEPGDLPARHFQLITFDVSFISLRLVVPPTLPFLADGGFLLPMIKPQFEVGKGQVGKGGIVRDLEQRRRTIEERVAEIGALGLELLGCFDSPVHGMEGNREAFALFRRPTGENPDAAGGQS
jgi:23S rRNA (cytidine1920-2'-O)/16S rRNA (cytidine1409-2'-O)-methyltransferase